MRSIKIELSGERPQEIIWSSVFVDASKDLDLRPRNPAQALFFNAHAIGEPCETLPVELSEGDEIYQGS